VLLLQRLKELVESRLVTRKYCAIMGANLRRCWPEWARLDVAERTRQLEAFAARHGWIARISPAGDRVTFHKSRV
jgi:hypothetical protein